MAKGRLGLGLGALVIALSVGATAPASAEFFGCNDKPGKLLYSYTGKPRATVAQASYARARHTHELSAQSTRPRITVHPSTTSPGPNAKRHCRSWLAKEYRVSGTVIVPRMQCWWQ